MPPAIIAAGIGAAGAIGGGLLASSGAHSAAKTEAQAQSQALAAQQQNFNTIQSEFAPYRTAGASALGGYGNLLGINGNGAQATAIQALQNSPYYKSLYRNGLEANLQNASATGGIRGGNEVRSLANFGADTLAQTIQQQLGNLGGLASLGEGAVNQQAGFGTQTAGNVGNIDMTGGANQASYQTASAGIMSGMFKNLAGFAQYAIGQPAPVGTQATGGLPDYNPSSYGFGQGQGISW